jgi:O-antigen/teichoic acid export membrane protein
MLAAPENKPQARSGMAIGILLVTGATYVTYAVGLLSNAIVARGLSAADFGRYAYVVWLCGWLVVITNNGLTTTGIRFIAELRGAGAADDARSAHGYLKRLGVASEWIVLAGFGCAVWIINPVDWRQALPVYIAVTILSALAKSRYLFDVSMAKGYGQFRIEAYSTIAVGSLTVLVLVVLFRMHAALTSYMLWFAASSVLVWCMAAVQLRRLGISPGAAPLRPALRSRLRPHLLWTTLLAATAVLGNKGIEVFLLNATYGPSSVGFFAIGAALTRGGIDLLTSGLMTVLMPVMAESFGRGGETQLHRIFSDSLRYFVFAGAVAAGAGFFLAGPTVQFLYGPTYSNAIIAFQVMVVVAGLTLSESSLGALLSTTDRQRNRAILVVVQVLITVAIAVAIIPRFGFMGALIAHATSRLLGFTLMFFWVSRMFATKPPVRLLLRILLAAVIAVAAAWLTATLVPGWIGQLLAAAIHVVVLLPLTVILRCWTRADFAKVHGLLQRHVRGAHWAQNVTQNLAARFGAT